VDTSVHRVPEKSSNKGRGVSLTPVVHFSAGSFVCLFIVALGYGFRDLGKNLSDYTFHSHILAAVRDCGVADGFPGSWLRGLPIPVPEAFIMGLDTQKAHADYGLPSYICDRWYSRGNWYYYLYGLTIKVPLSVWLLGALAALLAIKDPRCRTGFVDEYLLLCPAVVILLVVSSQTGINAHLRYILPVFPYLFISISRVGCVVEREVALLCRAIRQHGALRQCIMLGRIVISPLQARWARDADSLPGSTGKNGIEGVRFPSWLGVLCSIGIVGALGWSAVSSAKLHPHYVSYFNELVGGPENGWKHLINSNIDWGQDLLFLKRWSDEHPEARPLGLAYFGGLDPHVIGLEYIDAPLGPVGQKGNRISTGPQPGWYAVSVNLLCGMGFIAYDEKGHWTLIPRGGYSYFGLFTPVGKAGYSIFIYYISPDDADRARDALGLPRLSDGMPD
jgi:hypothetical protein